jgi:hypothetical protein
VALAGSPFYLNQIIDSTRSGRPASGEFASYARADIDHVIGDDIVATLRHQSAETLALLERLDERSVAGLTYAPGKWTLKEVIGHISDDERIFAYRMLGLARGDAGPFPGFDQEVYVTHAGFEQRTLPDLLAEYHAVRQATIALLASLAPGAWLRRGTVNGYEATVRGLAYHCAGHELRHVRTLRAEYLPRIQSSVL